MTKVLNLIPKAEQNMWGLSLPHKQYDQKVIRENWNRVISSQKMILPENGILFNDGLRGLPKVLNLPYNEMVVEYNHFFKSKEGTLLEGTIMLLEQDEDDITVSKFTEIGSGKLKGIWYHHPWKFIIHRDGELEEQNNTKVRDNKNSMRVRQTCIHPEFVETLDQERDIKPLNSYTVRSVTSVLELVEALSCSNVIISDTEEISKKLNKRREAKGKLPLYQYKILTLDVPITNPKRKDYQGGTHASPRQHLRRGHIRVYNRGYEDEYRIWINSKIIGKEENGIIEKRYRLTT